MRGDPEATPRSQPPLPPEYPTEFYALEEGSVWP